MARKNTFYFINTEIFSLTFIILISTSNRISGYCVTESVINRVVNFIFWEINKKDLKLNIFNHKLCNLRICNL